MATCTLGLTAEGIESNEVRGDGKRSVFRLGPRKIGGEVTFDLAYGDQFDVLLQAALQGTWTNNVLVDGATRRSFLMERHFAEQAAGDLPYHRFNGCEISALSLKVPAKGIVTGSMTIIGQDIALAGTAIADATYGAAGTNPVFDSFTGTLEEGGNTMGLVTEINLKLDNKMETRYAVGSKLTLQPSVEDVTKVSGSIGVHFVNATMLEKFRDEVESSLMFTLPDKLGNELTVTIPKLVYTGGSPDVKGPGNIVLMMPFEALYDSGIGGTLQFERDPVT